MFASFYNVFGESAAERVANNLKKLEESWIEERCCFVCKHDKDISDDRNTCHLCEYTNDFLPDGLTCLLWELKEEYENA